MANSFLIRARKAVYVLQRDFGQAVAEKVKESTIDGKSRLISPSYAQKKASLWESGQLTPTHAELQAMQELLKVEIKELEDSFSTGLLPSSAAADLIRALAESPAQGLIASCFAGRVRPRLFQEDEDALREAILKGTCFAIFFPYTYDSIPPAQGEYAEALMHQHREVWRSVLKYWRMLRSFDQDGSRATIKLYRPIVGGANVMFPPIFHRSTLLCERIDGRTKVNHMTWAQTSESDVFAKTGTRTLEDNDYQMESWELFFGGIFDHWVETGELLDGDCYWKAYDGQSETESD